MATEYPADLIYMDSHEYLRIEGDIVTIGITTFAIEELGDIVYLELFELDAKVETNDSVGTIESVKAVSDIYSPVSGVVVERNERLIEYPENVADDPYGEGWFIKIKVNEPIERINASMTVDEYKALVSHQ